jgi:rhamnose utilization protein RhaD (predicted bifunctional aldolase and dehydrogenase)/NAD(P)-dependent dehydrogenase (short-subunit alcohol dehydrogenase family)
MKNRWDTLQTKKLIDGDLVGLRVYSSRLLGAEADLVLHGGGNTSVKGLMQNVFGESLRVLYVKGSGWDLKTIEAPGFPPVDLDYLLKLSKLQVLSDSDMMKHLRIALLDPKAPTPSVEAILHALIPLTYVDHTHADAVVAISNSPDGAELLAELYGQDVLVLPYVMPGFVLAKQVAQLTADVDWSKLKGIVLMHHGIFTFADDAKTSYDTMIELVDKAERFLLAKHPVDKFAAGEYEASKHDAMALSGLRAAAGKLFGGPILLTLDTSSSAVGFACLPNAAELATRGPLTPDHTLHTKPFAAVFEDDLEQGLAHFTQRYAEYFASHAHNEHQCLDKMPRFGVWQGKGLIYLAANAKRVGIVKDIVGHTVKSIQTSEALGGWETLPSKDLFDVEYWELEQAKLKTASLRPEFDGKVAVITGAASGIGAACVDLLLSLGAAVVALDISTDFDLASNNPCYYPITCDVTDTDSIESAIKLAALKFGGIDLLVSNAGTFPLSATIDELTDSNWEDSVSVNLTSHMKVLRSAIPFLRNGFDPAVVFVGSKNVPAPGPGASAYSAAKAGLAQLARVAALELGGSGIRVNTVHPNAVYDTAIWSDAVLSNRAEHYGMTIEGYKANNVLGVELRSIDVALTVSQLLSRNFSKTTGAQIPVDGGNDRVI